MKTIKTLDIWTEQYPNHYECFNGAFIDGMDKGLAYTSFKVVKNCNCVISNNLGLSIGNKHNAIVFYSANGGNKPVRLLVADSKTDMDKCIDNALNQ